MWFRSKLMKKRERDPKFENLLRIVKESLKFDLVSQLISISKENDQIMQSKEYKKMIERHILFQIEIGWDVLLHINKAALMIMVLISFSIIFLGVDESLHLIVRRLAII
jgi:hypothetical protein